MHLLELIASLPPRSMTALPLFKQSTAASAVTFGLASKIIPITPRGTRTFVISIPLGLVLPEITVPIGSGRAATSNTPSAMPSILFSSSLSLSRSEAERPFFTPLSRSILFAEMIFSAFSLRAFAIALRASFFFSPAVSKVLEAIFAFFPIS